MPDVWGQGYNRNVPSKHTFPISNCPNRFRSPSSSPRHTGSACSYRKDLQKVEKAISLGMAVHFSRGGIMFRRIRITWSLSVFRNLLGNRNCNLYICSFWCLVASRIIWRYHEKTNKDFLIRTRCSYCFCCFDGKCKDWPSCTGEDVYCFRLRLVGMAHYPFYQKPFTPDC